VIYNSPYYGFATRADLFFDAAQGFPNLVGFKEFGGATTCAMPRRTSPRGRPM
jgi:dihydrodipicolinate synthase/N-acetylneuraminate lyase